MPTWPAWDSMGQHGNCFLLHDAEGHDGRYRQSLIGSCAWTGCRLAQILCSWKARSKSGRIPRGADVRHQQEARLHLVEVTFTTDFALEDRVAFKTAQHEQLCRCLADAGWSNVDFHLFIVGHTGVMGLDNARALLDLEAIAVMGCKFSCEMLKAYWCGPADISVPSPNTLNPAAVHLQYLLSGTAGGPQPCLLHMAAKRPPSRPHCGR